MIPEVGTFDEFKACVLEVCSKIPLKGEKYEYPPGPPVQIVEVNKEWVDYYELDPRLIEVRGEQMLLSVPLHAWLHDVDKGYARFLEA